MVHITFKGIKMAHTCVCLCAAFGFALWGIHLYLLDEDLTRIDVKQYNSGEESVYPSISFFFHSPIPNPEKLKKYDHDITPIMYKRFFFVIPHKFFQTFATCLARHALITL